MEGVGTLFKILRTRLFGRIEENHGKPLPVYEVCVGSSTAQSRVAVTADRPEKLVVSQSVYSGIYVFGTGGRGSQ
jgi:hypothetical protein